MVLGVTDTPNLRRIAAKTGMPLPEDRASPDAVAEMGLQRLSYGPVHNWGLADDDPRRSTTTVLNPLEADRPELAQQAGVPPYVVFHDSTLREMATLRPASLAALGEIGGVGTRKLEAYGDAFLEVIRRY